MENEQKNINVLIVDDHPLVRAGIKAFLSDYPFVTIVGESGDGEDAIEKGRLYHPDIILMDIYMPKKNGLEAAEVLLNELPATKIIFLTMYEDKEYIRQIFNLGAEGYVLKSAPQEDIIKAIEVVSRGYAYYSPEALSELWEIIHKQGGENQQEKPQSQVPQIVPELTLQEQQVLELLVMEYNNKQISEKLYISTRTVERHRFNIMQKLDIHTLVGLTKFAFKKGLLKID